MTLPVLPDDMEILSPRLKQEPMCRAHAPSMFPVLSDPRLYEFTGGSPPASVESLADLYGSRESRHSPDGTELWLNWRIWEQERGEAVGYTQATISPAHAYIAWVVGTEWHGRGYASEAALALVRWLMSIGVPEVRACVLPSHVASRRVAQNAGLEVTNETIDGEDVWTNRPHGA